VLLQIAQAGREMRETDKLVYLPEIYTVLETSGANEDSIKKARRPLFGTAAIDLFMVLCHLIDYRREEIADRLSRELMNGIKGHDSDKNGNDVARSREFEAAINDLRQSLPYIDLRMLYQNPADAEFVRVCQQKVEQSGLPEANRQKLLNFVGRLRGIFDRVIERDDITKELADFVAGHSRSTIKHELLRDGFPEDTVAG
jgi:hypothetical protein